MAKMNPRDLGLLEDDMSAPAPAPRGMPAGKMAKAAAAGGIGAAAAGAARRAARPMPNPADANIFTADKGIQPPSPDEGPTMGMRRPVAKKKGGCVKKMASGGSTGSASKRADGCATKGKTKGKII